MAVAAFKLDGKFNVGVDNQILCDGIVLERSDGHSDGINAADIRVAHSERFSGIESILAVYGHVFHVVHFGLFSLRLDAEGRGDVYIV